MKILLEYDESTGTIADKNGLLTSMSGMKGFDPEKENHLVLDLIKQGVTPDEIIKLNNNHLL